LYQYPEGLSARFYEIPAGSTSFDLEI